MCKPLPIGDIYVCIQTWNILYMMYVFTDMATAGTVTEGGVSKKVLPSICQGISCSAIAFCSSFDTVKPGRHITTLIILWYTEVATALVETSHESPMCVCVISRYPSSVHWRQFCMTAWSFALNISRCVPEVHRTWSAREKHWHQPIPGRGRMGLWWHGHVIKFWCLKQVVFSFCFYSSYSSLKDRICFVGDIISGNFLW